MKEKILNYFQRNWTAFYEKYLQQVKKAGDNECQALCPFHEDGKPSFSFNNQTGAYFCHGCNRKGNGFHFYARVHGLDTKRDFRKVLKGIAEDFGIPWEEQKSKIVKTYDYVDTEGGLLFQVCRMEPKDFRQRQPAGKNKWTWNLRGIQPVLYNLPALAKAEEVILVEGEKDADNIMALGFTATTNPMGAKKWRDDYNESLRDKALVLIPDNDNEGREHMTRIAISVNGTAKSLKWLELPGLKSEGDISDWIATFEDKTEAGERLAVMIENAEPYEPPKKKSLEDVIMAVSAFQAVELPEKIVYLMPWLKADSINLVSGWRGVGKTWFAMGVLDAISKGDSFGPWECEKPVPALLLDGEMPPQDIQERIATLGLASDRPCPVYIYSDALANQYGLSRAHLGNESWRSKMKAFLISKYIKVWCVDNLASLAAGLDENKKSDWDCVNQWLLELRFAGIATFMLHHLSKEGTQRGTSSREDNLDISLILKAPHDYSPEDGARFVVHFSKSRVSTKNLSQISDTEFKLIEDEHGQAIWTWKNIRRETKADAIRMLDEDQSGKAIADTLGISKSRVSQIRKEALNEGLLDRNGKLTQLGFKLVYGE